MSSAAQLNIAALRASPRVNVAASGKEHTADAVVLHFAAVNQLIGAQRRLPTNALGIPVIGYWVVESTRMNPDMVNFSEGLAQIWTAGEASKSALVASGVKVTIKVIPHPVALPATPRPSRDGQPFTVLTCGSAPVARKGYDLTFAAFQAAFPAAEYPDVRWVLKLRGIPDDKLNEIMQMTEADSRVTVSVGDVPSMTDVYHAADVYMQCHKAGAFEMHCAEAAVHGLPVLATDVGGVKDYLPTAARITPTGFGKNEAWDRLNAFGEWAIPDTEATGVALRALYADSAARDALATACQTQATTHCDSTRVADLMADALSEVPPRATTVDPRLQAIHRVEKIRLETADKIAQAGKRPRAMQPIRPGLELVGGGILSQAVVGVISHRRSGTHHLGETIRRAWEAPWAKSHAFPKLRDKAVPWIYIVRNPIDALHSTYEWFKTTGGAKNEIIAAEMDKCTFDQFIKGKAGRSLGYQLHKFKGVDNCASNRGMFYDPIQHWADHVREALDDGMMVITHEKLRTDPVAIGELLQRKIGKPPVNPVAAISEGVGLDPNPRPAGYAMPEWSAANLTLLNTALTETKWGDSLLSQLGFTDLNTWIASGNKQ
jgi:glycosyltransferase involved in cell wall biosynthesis